jgi:chromosome segregation ATPase
MRWEEVLTNLIDRDSLGSRPDPRARFGSLEAPYTEAKIMSAMQKDFQDWVYHNSSVTVRANEELEIYAGPEVPQAEFRRKCSQAAQEGRDEELDKVSEKFERKMDTLLQRMKREQRELEEDRSDLSQRKMEEYGTHAETVLSLFSRRRKSLSRSLSKRRMTEKAEADVKESIQAIEEFEVQIAELEQDRRESLEEVNERWEEIASEMTEIEVTPFKKDILVDVFGVAWFPYYAVRRGDQIDEIPGYGS